MKIIVPIKPCSDPELYNPMQSADAVPLILSPFDGYAVEAALRQKDAFGASVTVLCIGEHSAKDVLKHVLAMGADKAVLVAAPDELDSQVVARLLADAAQKLNAQLLIFGRQTLDHASGLTPAQTARVLGWPLLSLVESISITGQGISVERSFEEGRQRVRATLPAVVSVTQTVGEPRYPSFAGIRKAAKAVIQVLSLDGHAPVVRRLDLVVPPMPTGCEFISGETPAAIAQVLAAKILAEKVL